jgi:hypothetical protein
VCGAGHSAARRALLFAARARFVVPRPNHRSADDVLADDAAGLATAPGTPKRDAPRHAAAFVALEDGTTKRGGHLSAALARALGSVLELGARFEIIARLGRVARGELSVRGRLCNRWRCGQVSCRVSHALARPVRCCVLLPLELRHQSTQARRCSSPRSTRGAV